MYGWVGTVKLFNGKYWQNYDVKTKASSAYTAARNVAGDAIDLERRRMGRVRVEGIQVTLTRFNGAKKEGTPDGKDVLWEA